MGRIAPIVLLLVLAACSSGRDATHPPATPPIQANAPPAPRPSPTPPRGSSVPEVDELFRWLGGQPAAGAPAAPANGTGTARPAVVYTIPRADPAMLAITDREAQQAAYRENLAVCLDGRFPAFCDHGALTAEDAARVGEAEHQADLATCIDPKWQHLCRVDLLFSTPGHIVGAMIAPERIIRTSITAGEAPTAAEAAMARSAAART